MPERPQWQARQLHLDNAELVRLLRLFIEQGIEQLRLTGGEPLLRPDLVPLLEDLQALRPLGLQRISMTSNASRLAPQAKALAAAGLDDLNISLDCLDPALFQRLTGQPIAPVLTGIEAARAAGLSVKINTVLVRGYNETSILPLLDWAMREALELRFIEYMPLDAPGRWQPESVFTEDELIAQIATSHQIQRLPRHSDPATPWQVDGYYRLGVISTVSKPFCASCDRLRITADGTLYTCLFSAQGT
ncbi:molybdenum cofactor biosynthesis protein, partial [Lasius niger]